MHPGPDSMGAPASFAQRRPHAPSLPNFELPPPSAASVQKYSYPQSYPATQATHAPGNLASVGNLLTPPSTVSSETAGMQSNGPASHVPAYAQHGNYAWSPAAHTPTYGYPPATHAPSARGSYSPMNSAMPGGQVPPSPATTEGHMPQQQYSVSTSLPPYTSAAMSAATTLPTMAPHQPHPQHAYQQLSRVQTPVSTGAHQPSPIQAQDGFRPPATPAYYTQHPPTLSTPGQGAFQYSTGPSPTNTHPSPLSAGPMSARSQISPATPGGPMGAMPSAPAVQSPHPYPGRYAYPGAHAPVLSNISNPNGQPVLMGGLPHAMIPAGFNSGHAANIPHMYGSPHPQPTPHNDRPFKCDQCPQSFNRNHDLKRHKRIHLAVKPFPCGHCDKSFSRKDALKRHILVKGCGKPQDNVDGEKQDASASPDAKASLTDGVEVKPVIPTLS